MIDTRGISNNAPGFDSIYCKMERERRAIMARGDGGSLRHIQLNVCIAARLGRPSALTAIETMDQNAKIRKAIAEMKCGIHQRTVPL